MRPNGSSVEEQSLGVILEASITRRSSGTNVSKSDIRII